MPDKIPKDAYAIIIGAMKCGTSSLFSWLQEHPEICPAISKEPEFFSEHQEHGTPVERYEDLWSFDAAVHKYALEASTGYTKYPSEPNVPRKIYDYGIRPKFIYIIRNPYERIASHYNFMQKNETWRLDINDEHLINTSNYFLQLEQYRKYFPREDILILDFDELRDAPALILQKTYDFLGLTHDYFPAEYKAENPTPVQTQSRLEKRLKKLKFSALFGYVPGPLKQVGKSMLRKAAPPPKKRALMESEKRMVYEVLREDMANLQRVYGFDVRKWGFGA